MHPHGQTAHQAQHHTPTYHQGPVSESEMLAKSVQGPAGNPCPLCGKKNDAGDRSCFWCGTKLGGSAR
jgi:hypothetical protein